MNVIPLGAGSVPSVTAIPGGWRVAIGEYEIAGAKGIGVIDLDQDGRIIVTRTYAGFSYPVLDGPWLGYKSGEADGWCAKLRNLADDAIQHTYDPATGNFPLAIGHGVFVWQSGSDYALKYATLADPSVVFPTDLGAFGAPDGIAWVEPTGHVALCKDVRRSVDGMINPARCGSAPSYTYVGEQPDLAPQWPLGISTKLLPSARNGWTLGGQECNTPKIAESADGGSFAIVTYGREGIRLLLLTDREMDTLPKPPRAPGTQPPNPPETPPVSTVPNRSLELAAFHQQWNGGQPINDEAEKHRFTAAFAGSLNKSDRSGRWGRKSRAGSGQPVSKDTLGYWLGATVPTVETDGKIHAFDIITGSSGAVGWNLAAERGDPLYANIDARWYPVAAGDVEPPPPPPPVGNTHKYEGGGNDTGICDRLDCGKSRFDPIHVTAKSKVPHAYDPGENGTGLCDECQKGESDPIHHGVVEPPPPPPPPDGDLEDRIADLERRVMRLEGMRRGTFELTWGA